MKENIIKFLEGRYSLVFSYWTIGTLCSIAVGIPIVIMTAGGIDNMSNFAAFIVLVYVLFYFLFLIGSLVGIWRSAGFYIYEKNKFNHSPLWGYIARVIVVLGGLSLVGEVIKIF